jgi:hypothetical protein
LIIGFAWLLQVNSKLYAEKANFKRRRNRSILDQRLCTQGMMTSSNLREETPSLQMNLTFPERRFSFDPSNG